MATNNMTNIYAVKIIYQLINDYSIKNFKNEYKDDPEMLKQTSLFTWALIEMLKLLRERLWEPPLPIIEDFQRKMEEYSLSSDKGGSYNFSVAYDAAECVIDHLIAT